MCMDPHTPPARHDKTVLSAVWIESARQVRSASECVRRSHRRRTHLPGRRADWIQSHRRSSHDTDKIVLPCLAWRCELALSKPLSLSGKGWVSASSPFPSVTVDGEEMASSAILFLGVAQWLINDHFSGPGSALGRLCVSYFMKLELGLTVTYANI